MKLHEVVEDFGYVLGDIEDAIDREEPHFCDLIHKVAVGRLSASEAERIVHEVCGQWRRDLDQYKALRSNAARKYGYPHLHESLAFMETMPVARLMVRLPIPDEVA